MKNVRRVARAISTEFRPLNRGGWMLSISKEPISSRILLILLLTNSRCSSSVSKVDVIELDSVAISSNSISISRSLASS